MELDEIRQIIELMEKHEITSFSLKRDGDELKLRKGNDVETHPAMMWPQQQQYAQPGNHNGNSELATPPAVSVSTPPVPPPPAIGPMINSPMVGTFYRAASPTDEPFVREGDRVTPDTVVCIIEAMKVMNEIKAESSGIIRSILAEESKPVQYGQPLFELQP